MHATMTDSLSTRHIWRSLWLIGLLGQSLFLTVLAQSHTFTGKVLLPESRGITICRATGYGRSQPLPVRPAEVYVTLTPISFKPQVKPLPQAIITQKKEAFVPNVLMVPVGSTVYFLNEDNQFHNVFSRTPGASFNIGRRPPGHMYPQKIKRSGTVKIFCDVHAHMRAYVIAVETPYFIALKQDGSFSLTGLPSGDYDLSVIHPQLPPYTRRVTVAGTSAPLVVDLRNVR